MSLSPRSLARTATLFPYTTLVRSGSRPSHRGHPVRRQILQVIRRQRPETRGQCRPTLVRQLLGMQLDRQLEQRGCVEQPLDLRRREGDLLAERVDLVDQPLFDRGRQHLVAQEVDRSEAGRVGKEVGQTRETSVAADALKKKK